MFFRTIGNAPKRTLWKRENAVFGEEGSLHLVPKHWSVRLGMLNQQASRVYIMTVLLSHFYGCD